MGLESGSNKFFLFFFVWEYIYFLFIPEGYFPLGINFALGRSLLSALDTPLAFMLSHEKSAVSWIGVSVWEMCHFSLVAFKILSMSLLFRSLIMKFLGINFFEFILFRALSASWVYGFITLAILVWRVFSHYYYYFLNTVPAALSSSSYFGTLIMWMLNLLYYPWDSVHFFFQTIFLSVQTWWNLFFCPQVYGFYPPSSLLYYWAYPVKF